MHHIGRAAIGVHIGTYQPPQNQTDKSQALSPTHIHPVPGIKQTDLIISSRIIIPRIQRLGCPKHLKIQLRYAIAKLFQRQIFYDHIGSTAKRRRIFQALPQPQSQDQAPDPAYPCKPLHSNPPWPPRPRRPKPVSHDQFRPRPRQTPRLTK